MTTIIVGSLILSILHAAIPNHWLPVIAIGRKEKWSGQEVRRVTFIAALAHGLSTVILGIVLSFLGAGLAAEIEAFTHWIAPSILIILGVIFIYRHHVHKHFHVGEDVTRKVSKRRMIWALTAAMFFSPCMEIEAYFLLAGAYEPWLVWFIAAVYLMITITGMLLLVHFAYKGLLRMNWHKLEHNAGIITGITLVVTGIAAFFIS